MTQTMHGGRLSPATATLDIAAATTSDGLAVTATVDGNTFALPLADAWTLAGRIEDATRSALADRIPVTEAERRPFAGDCPPFCRATHGAWAAALDDYHYQPLGDVGVNHDPLLAATDDCLPSSVAVELIQHTTRDEQAFVGLDDGERCLRFTPDQARALAARLLQGARLLEAHR